MKKVKLKTYLIIIILIICGVVLFYQVGNRSINIVGTTNDQQSGNVQKDQGKQEGINLITGIKCENYNQRPFAVMLAEDPTTRPLSGISSADLVIEMLVTDNITRMMAVWGCESPEEIGSVRSARHDFIPLAMGLDAIYAHWGGSHFALDILDSGTIDSISALKDPYGAFWRKSNISAPHNGFTSINRLKNAAEKLGYRLISQFKGYPHLANSDSENKDKKILTINYPNPYQVYYKYNPQTNSYKRFRNNKPEIDKLTNEQVEIKNIVIMRAESKMIELPQYNDVEVEGSGELVVYRNGQEIKGTWRKEGNYQATKLYFLDQKGEEIKFVLGKIWVEIVNPNTSVIWEAI